MIVVVVVVVAVVKGEGSEHEVGPIVVVNAELLVLNEASSFMSINHGLPSTTAMSLLSLEVVAEVEVVDEDLVVVVVVVEVFTSVKNNDNQLSV